MPNLRDKAFVVKVGSVSVKVYPTPSGQFTSWTVVYYDTAGVRRRVVRADRDAAKTEAERLATLTANGQTAILELNNGDAAFLVQARQKLATVNSTLEACVEDYTALLKALAGQGTPRQAVEHFIAQQPHSGPAKAYADVLEEFLASAKQDGTGKLQLISLTTKLNNFGKSYNGPVAALDATTLDNWLRAKQKLKFWTGRTRNHHRAALSAFFSFAKQKKYLPRNWDEMQFVPRAKEEDGEIGIYSPSDFKKLLTGSGEHRVFFALGGFAGLRPSEIARMNWSDIHWDSNEIFIGKGKVRTAGHRVVPLLPACRAWLEPLKKKSGPMLTTPLDGAFYKDLVKQFKRIGVEPVHDGLRHSYISYRAATTKNLAQVSHETGTDPKTLTKRYRRPVKLADAEAWFLTIPDK